MEQQTKFEKALVEAIKAAYKAFAASYLGAEIVDPGETRPQKPKPPQVPQAQSSIRFSEGKVICTLHEREMREYDKKPMYANRGWYCTAKQEGTKNGYCQTRYYEK